jgi:peptidoglycan/LPS O-acetylase OafA/YrhL
MASMKKTIAEFDVMRSLAIFIILFHHLPDYSFNFYDLKFFGINYDLSVLNDLNRYFGLGIFFFISGYLLDASTQLRSKEDAKKFLISKAIRIFPLYIAALSIFILIFSFAIERLSAFSVLIHLAGLQMIFCVWSCDPILTLWFVSLIVVYYGLFIVLQMLAGTTRSIIVWSGVILLVCVILNYLFGVIDKKVILYLPIFIGGIIVSKESLLSKVRGSSALALFILMATVILCYVAIVYPEITLGPKKPAAFSQYGLYAFVCTNLIMFTFVLIMYYASKRVCSLGLSVCFSQISYSSYCIYLFHRPVLWLLLKFFNPSNDLLRAAYVILVGLPLVVLVAYSIQRSYDSLLKES